MSLTSPAFDQYLENRRHFAVSRELAAGTLDWAEPLARRALGVHAQRGMLGANEKLQLVAVLTSPTENGGWGELMPVWFKPYERPVPVFILDNWALPALLFQHWLGELGPEFRVENLLKVFVGGNILIPFLPTLLQGGHFLRHGSLAMLLGVLWLPAADRVALMEAVAGGARRFAASYRLSEQADLIEFLGQLEFEAFFIAEGSKIGGEEKVRAFLSNEVQFKTYAALFGGLCFSLAALYDWYGSDWETWVFQAINVDYRVPGFGLEQWMKWLG